VKKLLCKLGLHRFRIEHDSVSVYDKCTRCGLVRVFNGFATIYYRGRNSIQVGGSVHNSTIIQSDKEKP